MDQGAVHEESLGAHGFDGIEVVAFEPVFGCESSKVVAAGLVRVALAQERVHPVESKVVHALASWSCFLSASS